MNLVNFILLITIIIILIPLYLYIISKVIAAGRIVGSDAGVRLLEKKQKEREHYGNQEQEKEK
ncbi:MAG: hypothetical protein GWN01_09340 [Nitrosopumilaceae archaeon]|nr:hypothetical protein [Nitrosopumilaceae archaeon]NIU87813.1 hypothetical protein [Nitrosopumilaceae archaeon]NIV65195.1 hypothetical protein [Nitrosopumilaceae archaeon]NIX61711.1 hypothetical protein [Nitrosopumilaceae archaeon]